MKGSNPDLLPTFLFFESTTHKNESAKFRTGRGLKLLLLCKKRGPIDSPARCTLRKISHQRFIKSTKSQEIHVTSVSANYQHRTWCMVSCSQWEGLLHL